MYEQHPNPQHFTFRYVLIDQVALELWEHSTDEFVEFVDSEGLATYRGMVRTICEAAHARVNEEVLAAGIEMVFPRGLAMTRCSTRLRRRAPWCISRRRDAS